MKPKAGSLRRLIKRVIIKEKLTKKKKGEDEFSSIRNESSTSLQTAQILK